MRSKKGIKTTKKSADALCRALVQQNAKSGENVDNFVEKWTTQGFQAHKTVTIKPRTATFVEMWKLLWITRPNPRPSKKTEKPPA